MARRSRKSLRSSGANLSSGRPRSPSMPFVLEPSWLGRRVSVRRVMGRKPDGRPLFGDVVGDLVRLDSSVVVIDTRTGAVEFPPDSVTLARIAPPSTADELALQRVAASGWRAAEVG